MKTRKILILNIALYFNHLSNKEKIGVKAFFERKVKLIID
jgi:hypothetical protein